MCGNVLEFMISMDPQGHDVCFALTTFVDMPVLMTNSLSVTCFHSLERSNRLSLCTIKGLWFTPHIAVMNPSTPNAPTALSADRFGWALHWYDAATLLLKSYSNWFALDVDYKLPVFSSFLIEKAFQRNLNSVKSTGKVNADEGSLHVIIGETGVPFDVNGKKDLNEQETQTDVRMVVAALDRTVRAVEANHLEYVLWNYVHDNTQQGGDHWNGEDLSIRSNEDNRGLDAAVRPYLFALGRHGRIGKEHYDPYTGQYRLSVEINGCDESACTGRNGEEALASCLGGHLSKYFSQAVTLAIISHR